MMDLAEMLPRAVVSIWLLAQYVLYGHGLMCSSGLCSFLSGEGSVLFYVVVRLHSCLTHTHRCTFMFTLAVRIYHNFVQGRRPHTISS